MHSPHYNNQKYCLSSLFFLNIFIIIVIIIIVNLIFALGYYFGMCHINCSLYKRVWSFARFTCRYVQFSTISPGIYFTHSHYKMESTVYSRVYIYDICKWQSVIGAQKQQCIWLCRWFWFSKSIHVIKSGWKTVSRTLLWYLKWWNAYANNIWRYERIIKHMRLPFIKHSKG